MYRAIILSVTALLTLTSAVATTGCGAAAGKASDEPDVPKAVSVSPVAAVEQPLVRFIRATGSLTAEDQADVAAETAGRVVATPSERGTVVVDGTPLLRLLATETEAQVAEAEANAAQLEARLGITGGDTFDANAVPEVQTAQAGYELAEGEFARIKSLLEQRVVSQSEYDQRRTQLEASRQQLVSARNGATQQFQLLQAARARVTLARKALSDTVVRAPFNGIVAERLVSVGDYVTRGTKVAVVVRINPLRVRLTVPEQFISAVSVGQPVQFEVDAYPGRQFSGTVRYVSPSLETNQRALTIEAVVPNAGGELKPGLFATARIEQPARTPGLLVRAEAVQTASGTSRLYVVTGERVEERIVTVGQAVDGQVEITSGLKHGERVATKNVASLADGTRVN
jgi:RND family efflux transporter MFP subunit